MIEIYNWNTEKCIFSSSRKTHKRAIEDAVQKGINLDYADFTGWNLQGANLDDITIHHTRFCNANLTSCNLSEATFINCDFSGATLANACFAYADLHYCLFKYSIFGGADFHQVNLKGAVFSGYSWAQIPFYVCNDIKNCIFLDKDKKAIEFSESPLVILGLSDSPFILFRDHSVINNELIDRPIRVSLPTIQNTQKERFFY